MKMLLGLSGALPSLVEAKFASARTNKSLVFSPTEVSVIRSSTGIPFQLRYCPSLAKKPTPQKEEPKSVEGTHGAENNVQKKKFDPFDSPSAELLVANIPAQNPSHLLVLNKFPIISKHFILATIPNKKQTAALEQDDLEATYACLKAWQEQNTNSNRRLFAFFNSGGHSGASQPHRHVQFLPVESMHEGEQTRSWQLLLDAILSESNEDSQHQLQQPALPFTHFALKFPPEPTCHQLLTVYSTLFKSAREAVDKFVAASPDDQRTLHAGTEEDMPISYNLAMTTSGMAILPRRSEGAILRRDDGTELGFVALNGTTLAGTMMVKSRDQWDLLREQPEKLDEILRAIGIPRPTQ